MANKKLKIGIVGYGNLGKGVEAAVNTSPDMRLVSVFTRRKPERVVIRTAEAEVLPAELLEQTEARFEKPDVLIVDEILAVGDERFQRKSRERMMELMSGGTTVLFVSHNLEQIRQMCDHVVWLDHGKVRAFGPTEEICQQYVEAMA